ncbi:MAG: MBL fold metallo-hydrolase, partial [Methanobacteriota archaeon]
MPLKNEVWQQIPGTSNSWIYPLIRKPSITGSNSFIIRSGKHLMVIDPGAILDQMEKIRNVLSVELRVPNHPLLVIAGHIHIDHIYPGLTDRRLRGMAWIII